MKFYSKLNEIINKKINLSKEGIIALGLALVTTVSACSKKIEVDNSDNKKDIVENVDYEVDNIIKKINNERIYEVRFFEGTLTIKENEKSDDYQKIKYLIELLNDKEISIDYIPCNHVNVDFSEINLNNCTFGITFMENKMNKKRLKKSIKNISNYTYFNITIENDDDINYKDEVIDIINLVGLNNEQKYKSIIIKSLNDKLINEIIKKIDLSCYFNSFYIHSNDCKEYLGDLWKINSNLMGVIISNFDYDKDIFNLSNYTNTFILYYDDGNEIKMVYEYEKPKFIDEKDKKTLI